MNLLILLSCREALRRMDDYLDREADPHEARWVRAHLAICHACRARFAFEEQFIAAMRARLQQDAARREEAARSSAEPDELSRRILAALRQPPAAGTEPNS